MFPDHAHITVLLAVGGKDLWVADSAVYLA